MNINELVDRFLGWKLPKDFYPDCSITFDAEKARQNNGWPIGTNLLTADQAKAMLEYVTAPLQARIEARDAEIGRMETVWQEDRLEIIELRAKLAEIEQQEPVGYLIDGVYFYIAKQLNRDGTSIKNQEAVYGKAGAVEQNKDSARLDYMLTNDAFIVHCERDGSIKQCQLMKQDEDENYFVLSGEHRFFNTDREAIDAAMLATAPKENVNGTNTGTKDS